MVQSEICWARQGWGLGPSELSSVFFFFSRTDFPWDQEMLPQSEQIPLVAVSILGAKPGEGKEAAPPHSFVCPV